MWGWRWQWRRQGERWVVSPSSQYPQIQDFHLACMAVITKMIWTNLPCFLTWSLSWMIQLPLSMSGPFYSRTFNFWILQSIVAVFVTVVELLCPRWYLLQATASAGNTVVTGAHSCVCLQCVGTSLSGVPPLLASELWKRDGPPEVPQVPCSLLYLFSAGNRPPASCFTRGTIQCHPQSSRPLK